ncbi:general secretion pathway protein I [Candidatus Photodesmus blepharus]|uniref:Type II secretion system protein I n=2 Tax=Candidatus Photodesmus blepharonis TaxID=1179155 RepID=A0A084CNK1_9GAMM|nr:general secretion pathway protein I [Candidatus Photodesmus blepharus]
MTLLEVLFALVIFSMISLSVLQLVNQHINFTDYLEEKIFSAMVINNQMAKVILKPENLKFMQGEENLAGRIWYWTIEPVKTADDLLQAFDVSVSRAKSGSSLLTVRSYVVK